MGTVYDDRLDNLFEAVAYIICCGGACDDCLNLFNETWSSTLFLEKPALAGFEAFFRSMRVLPGVSIVDYDREYT